jgi:two-component system cell cycle sensor histidine kinase/response regulator CckA
VERLRTILVVENDSDIRRLIRDKLPKHLPGYAVIDAQDATEALSLAYQHVGPIDIVVADSVLGDLTMADMSHWLRMKYPRLKFIYMFGCGEDSKSGRNYISQGNALFLAKPFSMRCLSQAVHSLEDRETP